MHGLREQTHFLGGTILTCRFFGVRARKERMRAEEALMLAISCGKTLLHTGKVSRPCTSKSSPGTNRAIENKAFQRAASREHVHSQNMEIAVLPLIKRGRSSLHSGLVKTKHPCNGPAPHMLQPKRKTGQTATCWTELGCMLFCSITL